ncbi:Mycophenolic acid synthesis protein B [Colletotrichum spinosum]|nr:Mycophenolic acid synthesis protein B [Colletotrichum spinosum]
MDAEQSNLTMLHGFDLSSFSIAHILKFAIFGSLSQFIFIWAVALVAGWVVICAGLRFKRINGLRKQLGYTDRASLAHMTNEDAQIILKNIIEFEFPKFYLLALQFAIFKTYAFETVSKLIVATKELADPKNAHKRYEDTTIIFGEFSLNPPTSDRTLKAISRMNYLHSRYKNAGQISNADFLYTLAVCVTEPIRFMQLYEWRPLTDMEVCAIGTHWKAIGDAMDIRYNGYLSQDSWADGIEFAHDITAWAKRYEVEAMKPAKINTQPSSQLMNMMLFHIPTFVKPFAEEVFTVLMGDRVRDAFGYREPGIIAALTAYSALVVRRFVVRYMVLPRFAPVVFFSEPEPKTGRIQHYDYLVHPYYNPVTLWSRWGPVSLITRALGGTVPGSDKMMPDGFLFEEIGPKDKLGKGKKELAEGVDTLKARHRGGCPFSG